MLDKLKEATGLDIYPKSVVEATEDVVLFMARKGTDKFVGVWGPGCWEGLEEVAVVDDKCVCVGPCDHTAAEKVREILPWTAPKCIGLGTSAGLGDRLGLATPGHIRAIREKGKGKITPILAQQSIREMTRTERTPQQVMDCATFGVLQEGYRDGFGSDADHLQQPEDIDSTYAAGFTMFTIDPGLHVVNEADEMVHDQLADEYGKLDFDLLDIDPAKLKVLYVGKVFELKGGLTVDFNEDTFLRGMVKYGKAIAHTVKMYRHLESIADRDFELEVSVDETDSPTTPAEHFLFANELKRLGVKWVSMAPRFIGRFEKGVDYIGDIPKFTESFARHVAVMRTVGPYKMSIHSGSDKFSIYPIVAHQTEGVVHLKTAGTSYLEAVRALAHIDPDLFRQIYDFAREHYDEDKKTYHVSADMSKVPPSTEFTDDKLAERIDDFDTRQALHCTFGSVLTADGGKRFKEPMYAALEKDEETHYKLLAKHLGRHVDPFVPN